MSAGLHVGEICGTPGDARRGEFVWLVSFFVHQTKQTERPNEPDRLYDLSASASERLSEPRATLVRMLRPVSLHSHVSALRDCIA